MKRFVLSSILLLLSAVSSEAQFTLVSATITDPQGLRYSNGTVSIQLVTPGGTSPTLNGASFTGSFGPLTLDATGSFVARLADNNVVLPTGTRWTFTVCPQTGSPCTTTAGLLITGATQSLTGTINAIVGTQVSGFPTPFPASGGLTPTLNVKDARFGAKGDTQQVIDAATTNGTATLTSATGAFLPSDNSKTGFVIRRDQTGSQVVAPTTVTFVNSTTVTLGTTANFTCAANCTFTWGTPDDTAILAAVTAAQTTSRQNGPRTKYGQIIYVPGGGYMISQRVFNLLGANGDELGTSVIGDGSGATYFYVRPDTTFPAAGAPLFMMGGFGNTFQGFVINGSGFLFNTGSSIIRFRCIECTVRDVFVAQLSSSGFGQNLFEVQAGNRVKLFSAGASIDGTVPAGDVTACAVGPSGGDYEWYGPFCSNLNRSLLVTNLLGGGTGQKVSFFGGTIDECGTAPSCTDIVASSDVYFFSTLIMANNSLTQFAMTVDGTSTVRDSAVNQGCFSAGFTCTNANALRILAGGTVIATESEYRGGSVGGVALTNNGTFIDANGNVFTGANLFSGNLPITRAVTFASLTNCSSSANPAVCGSSASGSVVIAAGATSVVVQSTAVTPNSQIQVNEDQSLGTKLGVTCNTGFLAAPPIVSARTGGTSFTISISVALAVNPVCFSYTIIN